ncbi:MAG: Fe-S oxidoreductase [Gammaproteobacteria bacterium]|jgi:glycerol-3-phosphate dehydrogenase subunit C|nr:Fe-S oxidoreductase [Gammaproteobacteria bacterium]NCW20219.1 Fe-S oxidoreductase [Gammaproteobacteria bacterium]NCW56100.1 Fe-S oxidoreductase [Gammaproteobacteria bacterium]NDB15955.1 Fe-S oxidoreductase [Gammaproteobacteria bacterium]NDB24398.1 Fe-S oxidoreductase [Gammaproteobacteria bacterium]
MSNSTISGGREGSLEAPTRHPLNWRDPSFYDESALEKELERVFDICHGCRRCFSLCNSFPTLFDAVDAAPSGELDTVDKKVYWDVVDHCYLCDMCYMTKCPYVPPHPWNLDFPHLMLRAKAIKAKKGEVRLRDKILSATDVVGSLAGIPVVAQAVNAVNKTAVGRQLLDATLGVAVDAPIPDYHSNNARKQLAGRELKVEPKPTAETRGKVVLFTTCYGNRNEPDLNLDLVKVFEHNGIPVKIVSQEKCCGMPKLELGDLETVARHKETNIPALKQAIDEGYDIVAPIPSCVLMFKQELPLMFPEDADVQAVKASIFDPFEYLMLRHKAGLLRTDFVAELGKVSYHVPCHLRVQNIGLKTRDVLKLVPNTNIDVIERCSGHNGTYAVKKEFRPASVKIGKPVMSRVEKANPDHYTSDCPMAGHQIETGLKDAKEPEHPLKLLRKAYGI